MRIFNIRCKIIKCFYYHQIKLKLFLKFFYVLNLLSFQDLVSVRFRMLLGVSKIIKRSLREKSYISISNLTNERFV